jgi:cyclohexanecarboxylate-CoA ligase
MNDTFAGFRLQSPAAWLAERGKVTPDTEAAVDPHERVTYGQLLDRVVRVAGALEARGVAAGDVVVHQLPNRIDALVLSLAVGWRGATLCPIVPIYREREVAFILDEVRPRVFVTLPESRGRAYAEEARALCAPRSIDVLLANTEGEDSIYGADGSTVQSERLERALDARSVILFTSGTTSVPKGVIHTDRNLMIDCASLSANDGLSARDVLFVASTMTHVSGLLYAQYLPLMLGCKLCLVDHWSAEAGAAMIERERCTWTGGATPFLQSLVYDPIAKRHDLSSLRIFRCGGAEVPPTLIEAADRAGIHAYRSYGSSEHPTVSGGR